MATIYTGKTSKGMRVRRADMPNNTSFLDIVITRTALTEACEHHGVDSDAIRTWLDDHPDHPVAEFVFKLIKAHVPSASFKVKNEHLTRTQQRDLDLYNYVQQMIQRDEAKTSTDALSQIFSNERLKREMNVMIERGPLRRAYKRGKMLA
ncbi:hypothetical protein N9100_00920 [Gammaproteobacteria bacterium]|nr:hypothetical protein [Gammaproteobacteria bacterium]